ncbi:E3 ubiquitin-protein ligase RAD18 isoform X1 [Gadus chalcogrammus]|uniref:E3 ubiquitin-protein ligase RAD18 isoform X1 n=1 Tax=Gadus chalcogrammus TaxID=1042646 RepID=UPI0024C4BF91|nr:E3 ubiquitin-protein ligase RAD18 isoform X1 [Gadus chalcogrammus]
MALQNEADLPPSLTCLKNVDTLLRCPICFDFVSIAMMTKCSHNFCSLCIRKFLSYKLQCPVCNSSTTEQDLRNNRILDDLVTSFQSTRLELSKVSFDSPPQSPPTSAVRCSTPRARGPARDGSILSHFIQKGLKASPSTTTQQGESTPRVSRTRIQARLARASSQAELPLTNTSLGVAIKEEIKEEEIGLEVTRRMEVSPSVAQAPTASSLAAEEDVKPVIKVDCPVCSVGIPQQMINKHLDSCLTRGEKKESLRSSLVANRKPMGKLVYHLLSLQDLRRRLRDCHLPTQGQRDHLVRRHQDFVHIYNAQCDSLSPKSVEDIAKEVQGNEKMRNQLQGKAKPVLVFSKYQSEEEIDEVHSSYRKQHSSTFSRLVSQVKNRLKTRPRQEAVPEGDAAARSQCTASGSQASAEDPSIALLQAGSEEPQSEAEDVASVSPAGSVISISSSVSDIIGPEPETHVTCPETTPARKRPPAFRDEDGSPPLLSLGKRCRKT